MAHRQEHHSLTNAAGFRLTSAVIFLFAPGGQVPLGTAFVVGYPVPGRAGESVPLIVTAKHVIGDHSKVVARFTTQEGKTPGIFEYDLKALRKSGDLWEHADRGVDIVVFRTPVIPQAKFDAIPLDLLASKEIFTGEEIQPTNRVIFLSLLVNFMGLSRNYPVIRDGSIALIPDEDVSMKYQVGSKWIETKQRVILIDATTMLGASDSPVFLFPVPRIKGGGFTAGGGKPYVLGVLHGFYPAVPREVQEVEAGRTKKLFSENSGIAIVFPSWRLLEILQSPGFENRIKKLLATN